MKPKKDHIWLIFETPELIVNKINTYTVKFTNLPVENEHSWDYPYMFGETYIFYTDVFAI